MRCIHSTYILYAVPPPLPRCSATPSHDLPHDVAGQGALVRTDRLGIDHSFIHSFIHMVSIWPIAD